MAFYAIGDIQGCYAPLMTLLDQIYAIDAEPQFLFLGDLVNRGPDSLAVLRAIYDLGDHAKVVLGNHDLHLLAVANGIRQARAGDTLQSILSAPDKEVLLDWLRHCPLAYYEDAVLAIHAGVVPAWSAQQARNLALEVEKVLQAPDWLDFMRQMYGNAPLKWNDALAGMDRLRCIVNILTRIRFCHGDGSLDFSNTDSQPQAADSYRWFEAPGRQTKEITILFGHWSALGLWMAPHLIGLDTGCVWGGKLTAVRLADRALFQVDNALPHG